MRRRLFAGLVSLCLTTLAGAAQRERKPLLPAPRSLGDELAAALATGQPLLVLVSLEGCPWCKLVRESYLAPLRHGHALPVVQVDMGSRQALQDFAGAWRTHEEMVRAWRVDTAPTLLFFGRGAREVAPRLVGAAADFYGAYLEERLHRARGAVRP
ncbi:hypothetical protein [Ramlibacter tataouinensis]|uniref:Thioredoxin domain-containing protein n=1 Tax=Ramlibacter tataouinensis (strain ATCC BAA-407 / DSM 14655 / LMG 21543 / TTB310) TaxID=365046 RepID=F5Y3I9_RAMTT|nr:hypothetical protein [Ramlibacter tataouinensis]AEG92463.1 conserved hypothetical protein [Ramlibacter tataouinensis TTB310]